MLFYSVPTTNHIIIHSFISFIYIIIIRTTLIILVLQGIDFVLTDLAAGLFLLNQSKPASPANTPVAEERITLVLTPSSPAPTSLEIAPKPWMTVSQATHYMHFAQASYGWAFYVYSRICTGFCTLSTKCV